MLLRTERSAGSAMDPTVLNRIQYEETGWRLTDDGKMYRRGTRRYLNGDEYVGEWLRGKRAGKGQQTYASGDQYVGA